MAAGRAMLVSLISDSLAVPEARLPSMMFGLPERAAWTINQNEAGVDLKPTESSAIHSVTFPVSTTGSGSYRSRPASCQAFLTGESRYSSTVRSPRRISAWVCIPAESRKKVWFKEGDFPWWVARAGEK